VDGIRDALRGRQGAQPLTNESAVEGALYNDGFGRLSQGYQADGVSRRERVEQRLGIALGQFEPCQPRFAPHQFRVSRFLHARPTNPKLVRGLHYSGHGQRVIQKQHTVHAGRTPRQQACCRYVGSRDGQPQQQDEQHTRRQQQKLFKPDSPGAPPARGQQKRHRRPGHTNVSPSAEKMYEDRDQPRRQRDARNRRMNEGNHQLSVFSYQLSTFETFDLLTFDLLTF
jgi:hypothetical protein